MGNGLGVNKLLLDAISNGSVNDGEFWFASGNKVYFGTRNSGQVHIISGPKLAMSADDLLAFSQVSSTPAAPGSSTVKLFPYRANSISNTIRPMFSQLDANGITNAHYAFQPFFAQKKIGMWSVQGQGTTVSVYGTLTNTTAGTATSRSQSTGSSVLAAAQRIGFVSANTAGSSAGVRQSVTAWYRGDSFGGGFHFITRFGVAAVPSSTTRWFVGFTNSGSIIGNVDPSSLLNIVGFGVDSADTNVQLMSNDGSGTATKTDLGASFPGRTANAVYEVGIFNYRGSSSMGVYCQRFDSAQLFTANVITDFPSTTTFLSPQLWINNGANTGQVALDVISQYIESDF